MNLRCLVLRRHRYRIANDWRAETLARPMPPGWVSMVSARGSEEGVGIVIRLECVDCGRRAIGDVRQWGKTEVWRDGRPAGWRVVPDTWEPRGEVLDQPTHAEIEAVLDDPAATWRTWHG